MSMNEPVFQPTIEDTIVAAGGHLTVGPALAHRILTECHYAGQRRIDEQHALLLGMEMEQGTFLADTQLAFAQIDGGALHLLNGRHRMHAVELSGRHIRFSVVIYPVDTAAELGSLYCRFDTMVRKRTAPQIISASGIADEDAAGLGRPAARILYAATPLLMLGFAREAHPTRRIETRNVDRRIEFARDWKDAAILYQKCLAASLTALPARFRSVGVAAVAFATLRYQPELGEVFWSYAVANDALRVGDPRRTLHLDLVGRTGKRGTEYDLAKSAATAWNAFFEKRPLKLIRALEGPIRIAGTPFGTQVRP